MDIENIGQIVKALRLKERLKQHELADLLGVTDKYISAVETGTSQPSLDFILCFLEKFEMSAKELYTGEEYTFSLDESVIKDLNKLDFDQLRVIYNFLRDINKNK